MRRLALLMSALLALLPAAAAAQDEPAMVKRLTRYMRAAGPYSGAYVVHVSGDRPHAVFRWRQRTPRILASNTKLFTTTAALARLGVEGKLFTDVLASSEVDAEGVLRGSLYLRGGGDPTFGSRRFTRRSYGGGATVQDLAALLEQAGIQRVSGRVYGDESAFDSLRGGPDSGYGVSPWVGPLSALAYNRGLFTEGGRGFQANPPAFAAARLDDALEAAGVPVRLRPRAGVDARRRPRACDRRVAPDGASYPAHQQAVGQLLRRNAAEGPGVPGRRRRDHGRGGADRRRARARARRARHARGRLGPRARQPRLAPQRRAAPERHLPQRRLRPVRRLAADRGPGRDPLRPHATGTSALALPRQDGHALQRERAIGLLRGPERRQLRLFDPDERRVPHSARRLQDRMLQAIAAFG